MPGGMVFSKEKSECESKGQKDLKERYVSPRASTDQRVVKKGNGGKRVISRQEQGKALEGESPPCQTIVCNCLRVEGQKGGNHETRKSFKLAVAGVSQKKRKGESRRVEGKGALFRGGVEYSKSTATAESGGGGRGGGRAGSGMWGGREKVPWGVLSLPGFGGSNKKQKGGFQVRTNVRRLQGNKKRLKGRGCRYENPGIEEGPGEGKSAKITHTGGILAGTKRKITRWRGGEWDSVKRAREGGTKKPAHWGLKKNTMHRERGGGNGAENKEKRGRARAM